MSHTVVKILVNNDGERVEAPVWCLVVTWTDAATTFCGGEVFESHDVQSDNAESKQKTVTSGGITCRGCLAKIKEIKSIKL